MATRIGHEVVTIDGVERLIRREIVDGQHLEPKISEKDGSFSESGIKAKNPEKPISDADLRQKAIDRQL